MSGNEAWDVFECHDPRLYLANDPRQLGPDPPLVLGAEVLAGDAVRLTREARSEEIHDATPRFAVEGVSVTPDRRRIHVARFHTRRQ